MYSLVFKHQVYEMLDEAYWWYEQQLSGLGDRLLDEIESCFDKLQHTPFHYSTSTENYRSVFLKKFPYRIVFRIIEQEVVVYAVFHTSRNPESMFE